MRFTRRGREIFYNGHTAKLAGILAGAGGSTTTDSLDPPFEDDFATMVGVENNFHRHWLVPYWNYSPLGKGETLLKRNALFTRSYVASEDRVLWNLFGYNADYFLRLNQMITKAAQVGVVVQLVLFDRSGLDTTGSGGAESWTDPVTGLKYNLRRWDDNPWNAQNNSQPYLVGATDGLPEFFLPHPGLRSAQQSYIQQVVGQTKNHWNVFYEIMNEPNGGSADDRVKWADWVVGVIHAQTGGASMVFYNDFRAGTDVNRWKELNLPNYQNFHGVIFHSVPTTIDPDAADAATKYKFLQEKIFQVSTDGNSAATRDDKGANYGWCQHSFRKKMIFQAHSTSGDAALGIGLNHPTALA
jgi:hypothetical protein